MTNNIFKTKEQYLQFRKAFAAASRSGNLRAEHFIFLNIVRGLPYTRGFTPVTKKTKLANGFNIFQGLDDGVRRLRKVAHSANDIKQIPSNRKSSGGYEFRQFIEPLLGDGDEFLNVVLMQMLCAMETTLSEHKVYYTSFGEGIKIAQKMIDEDLKPINYQQFTEIVEEIANSSKQAA